MASSSRRPNDRRNAAPESAKERAAAKPAVERRAGADERRGSVRVAIDLWMEEVRGDEIYFRRSCNISTGGVFFDQSIPHPTGTKVTLRFMLPGTTEVIEVAGEVVSATRVNDGLGMGVKFVTPSAAVKAQLGAYIDSILAKRSA